MHEEHWTPWLVNAGKFCAAAREKVPVRIGILIERALVTIGRSLAHQGFSYHFRPDRNVQRGRAFFYQRGDDCRNRQQGPSLESAAG